MPENTIIYNIIKNTDGSKIAKLAEESRSTITIEEASTLDKLGAGLISSSFAIMESLTTEALKHGNVAQEIQMAHKAKLAAISLPISYLMNLEKARLEYGDDKARAEFVATVQTAAGQGFTFAGGVGGGVAGSFIPGVGTTAGSVGGAAGMSFMYESMDIKGNTLNGWIGIGADYYYKEFVKNREILEEIKEQPFKYEKHIASDYSKIQYMNVKTGEIVYEEKTGVQAKGDVLYSYSAFLSKEQLAQKLGIPIERIIEKIDIVDGRLNPYAAFTILPEPKQFKDSKFNWQEPNIDPASFQSAYDRYSHHSSGSTKTYEVKKGDTIWKVAKNHGMTVDELLRVPGNEYLRNHGKSFDDLGLVNILIKPGFKINIPDEQEYRQHTWNHHSTYGDPIRTTTGHYSFMNDFNFGDYKSPYMFGKTVYPSFNKWESNVHEYNQQYAELINKLRKIELNAWKYGQFTNTQEKYAKEYAFYEQTYKKEYNTNTNTGSWKGVKAILDQSGRLYGEMDIKGTNAAYTATFWKNGFMGGIKFRFPLVIDLKNDGIKLIALEESTVFYDFDNQGYLSNVGWPDKEDALLAIDANDDGIIDQAREIVFKMWDERATTDLDGLKLAFDENRDGKIDNKDSAFNKLKVWQDYNQNGVSEPEELKSLPETGIETLLLDVPTAIRGEMEQGGNIVLKAVTILSNKGIGNLYDVVLKSSMAGISYEEDYGSISLHYLDGKQVKVYKAEREEGDIINLQGTNYEVAFGGKGSDNIKTADKSTVVDGYEGDDTLTGGKGNDWLKGGEGADIIKGGAGHDVFLIDAQDNIDGGEGYDVALVATKEAVTLDLSKANIEAVYGNIGDDVLIGKNSPVAVYIDGGEGDDYIEGSDHDDILLGGKGKDKIYAGKGDDTIFIDEHYNLENIDAGEGEDSVFIYGTVGFGNGTVGFNRYLAFTEIMNVENIFGSMGDDNLSYKGDKNIVLFGNAGNDWILGGGGNDVIDGGPGDDNLSGWYCGNEKYLFYLGAGKDTIRNFNTEGSQDIVLMDSSIKRESLVFTKIGHSLNIAIHGNDSDSLTIMVWFSNIISSDNNHNRLDGFILNADTDNPETIVFKSDGDNEFKMEDGQSWTIFTMDGNDKIGGGDKADFISSGGGKDEIIGWNGDDTITGGPGDGDYLQGWSGNDTYLFYHGDGKDIILDEYKVTEIREGVERGENIIEVPYQYPYCTRHMVQGDRYGYGGGFREVCRTLTGYKKVAQPWERPYKETIAVEKNGGEADKIKFGEGIKPTDLIFNKSVNDLIVGLKEAAKPFDQLSNTLTIKNWFIPNNKIEFLAFEYVNWCAFSKSA